MCTLVILHAFRTHARWCGQLSPGHKIIIIKKKKTLGDSSKISKKPILLIDHFKYKLNHTILPHINHLQNTHSRNFITSNMHVRLYTLKCTSDYFMFNVLVNILYRDIYVCVTK